MRDKKRKEIDQYILRWSNIRGKGKNLVGARGEIKRKFSRSNKWKGGSRDYTFGM